MDLSEKSTLPLSKKRKDNNSSTYAKRGAISPVVRASHKAQKGAEDSPGPPPYDTKQSSIKASSLTQPLPKQPTIYEGTYLESNCLACSDLNTQPSARHGSNCSNLQPFEQTTPDGTWLTKWNKWWKRFRVILALGFAIVMVVVIYLALKG